MKILITGASGFLGSKLVKKFIMDGFKVYGLSRKPITFTYQNFHHIKGDLFDIDKIEKLDIDVIIHTAANINFDESCSSISKLTRDNIISTSKLADFAIKNNVKKFIHSSSCSVYEDSYDFNVIIGEDYSIRPRNAYAISKLTSEWILENKLNSAVEELVILRYSSIYGYGQREGSIVPAFIRNVNNNENLMINGSGSRTQDYVYIDDVVDANLKCLEKKLSFNTVLNIGSGEQISDLMLAEHIRCNWDSNSKINILNNLDRPETHFNYDIKKAKSLINYESVTLKVGLELYKKSM
jgi:nucleoside-diphosphate-sugar epimerase